MASIRRRNGKFQAQVRRLGTTSISRTFTHKKDAVVWVRGIEARIDVGETNVVAPKTVTLGDVMERYSREITPQKKGCQPEQRRLFRLSKDAIAKIPLAKLTSTKLATFRDRRIQDGVRAAQYDLILIRHALKIARLEWGISLPSNPVDNIRVPNGIRRRERRLEDGEYQKLKDAAQSCRNQYIWPVVEFALETAMRRSEILSLQWQNTDLDAGLAILLDTKNGSKRKVPLTRRARRVISQLPTYSSLVFDTTDYSIRHGWDRLVKRAGIKNLRFHDLRHEAVSRLFEAGLSVPEVALVSGHKDFRMLARYTHMKAETLRLKDHFEK